MIKNELIKFFTPLKILIYGGFLIVFVLLNNIIFGVQIALTKTLYDFIHDNIFDLIIIIPIMLSSIVSEIFTYDYQSGCMKFFLIYKKRDKVFISKIISIILITAVLIIAAFFILTFAYIVKDSNHVNISREDVLLIIKTIIFFLIALLPILFIYALISIIFKNSAIISLLVFLLVIMSDFFSKTIGDITPRRFCIEFLLHNRFDKYSIILFAFYLIIFGLCDISIFTKKEILR